MKKQYFRKKEISSVDNDFEWIQMSGQEFYQFITSSDGRGRYFIDMGNIVIEAPRDIYKDWHKEHSRQQYRNKQIKKLRPIVMSLYRTDSFAYANGETVIPDNSINIEDEVIRTFDIDALHIALLSLDPISYHIIYSYYLAKDCKSEQEISTELGISQPALHKRKKKILKKLKTLVIKQS